MDIARDPFAILHATTRDDKSRLMELAKARSVEADPVECMDALAELLDPEKRVEAEVAWLPGVEPARAEKLLALLDAKPSAMLIADKIPAMARANLYAAALSREQDPDPDLLCQYIFKITDTFSKVDPSELRVRIDRERTVAGLDSASASSISRALDGRARYFMQCICIATDELDFGEFAEVACGLIDRFSGAELPKLAADFIRYYEEETIEFFADDEKKITEIAHNLRTAADDHQPDYVIAPLVDHLIAAASDFDSASRPIAALGGVSPASAVAQIVRDIAVDLYNKYDKTNFARKITNALWEMCGPPAVEKPKKSEPAPPKDTHGAASSFGPYSIDDRAFRYRGRDYALRDVASVELKRSSNEHGRFFFVPPRDGVELRVTMSRGDELKMSRTGITLIFHKFGARGVKRLSDFGEALMRATFSERLARYETAARDDGAFTYGGVEISPRDKIVFGEHTFKAGVTTFTRDGATISMKSADHGLVERFRFLSTPPKFELGADHDVILHMLEEGFGADLSRPDIQEGGETHGKTGQ